MFSALIDTTLSRLSKLDGCKVRYISKCEYKAIFLENSRFSVKNTFFGDHYFGEVDVFINLQNSALQEIFYKIFLEKLL